MELSSFTPIPHFPAVNTGSLFTEADPDPNQRGAEIISGGAETISGVGAEGQRLYQG